MNGLHLEVTLAARAIELELSVAAGETLAILGANGAGKSTVLDLISGLLWPDSGRITLGDRILVNEGSAFGERCWIPPHARGTVLLAQDALLFPHLSVLENVAFGPRSRGVSKKEAADRAVEWLSKVGAVELADRRPHQLSGGQSQRVALARALAAEPTLLLLDEPFSALDAGAIPEMRRLMATVLTDHTAVLVTHDPLDALALASRVVVLDGGSVVESGETRSVLYNPRAEFTKMLAFGLGGDVPRIL